MVGSKRPGRLPRLERKLDDAGQLRLAVDPALAVQPRERGFGPEAGEDPLEALELGFDCQQGSGAARVGRLEERLDGRPMAANVCRSIMSYPRT